MSFLATIKLIGGPFDGLEECCTCTLVPILVPILWVTFDCLDCGIGRLCGDVEPGVGRVPYRLARQLTDHTLGRYAVYEYGEISAQDLRLSERELVPA